MTNETLNGKIMNNVSALIYENKDIWSSILFNQSNSIYQYPSMMSWLQLYILVDS